MSNQRDIPRSEPPGDDGAFLITYQDERVPCPECEGSGRKMLHAYTLGETFEVDCAVCNGRKMVSPIFASQWRRMGS